LALRCSSPDMSKRLGKVGLEVIGNLPAEFAAVIKGAGIGAIK